jgi:N-acetylglucosamine-6-phosphate deacetylase
VSLLVSGQVARGGALVEGWIEIRQGRVAELHAGRPPRTPDEQHDGIIAPGLCDLEVNGGAGLEVTDGEAALDAIDALQLAHGVTSYLPTIVTTDSATAERATAELEDRVADPRSPVAGIHLEGPFLAPAHAGVHRRELLAVPADGIPGYYDSGAVRLVTLAPELPGALELIGCLRARGVAVSLGHSGADAGIARAALDAGAAMVTHIFNAMGPLHHRAPGIVGVALADARVRVCVIADGLHVDPLVLELVRRLAGPRVVLVTDATPAAGAPAGRYEMAGRTLQHDGEGGERTLDGRLAGSTLTLDAAVRSWATETESTLAEAIAAASEVPAAALGLPALAIGAPADLVLFDAHGFPQRVMRRGEWLT